MKQINETTFTSDNELITFIHGDCTLLMKDIESNSIDVILTDPPYKYLKNQKLEVDFDETIFFNEVKRVLKPDGFIVLFGRGTSFYRWNTILADLGFVFKEEVVWDKSHCTSPLMAMSRVHETISIHTKKNGKINKVKIPYLEMKSHNIDSVIQDVNRIKGALNNTKSLNSLIEFLKTNYVNTNSDNILSTSISSIVKTQDRAASCLSGIKNGLNEKTIIRTDWMGKISKNQLTASNNSAESGDRSVNCLQTITFGLNEKSIIKQIRDHYTAIHPTQKPVRLLERLLNLVAKKECTVLDPFAGSFSTAEACKNLNFKFKGIELDKEYLDKAIQRFANYERQQTINFE